jgi:hypothetical protein
MRATGDDLDEAWTVRVWHLGISAYRTVASVASEPASKRAELGPDWAYCRFAFGMICAWTSLSSSCLLARSRALASTASDFGFSHAGPVLQSCKSSFDHAVILDLALSSLFPSLILIIPFIHSFNQCIDRFATPYHQ